VYPDIIPLPDGYLPEGITEGRGHTFYAGTINGGAIYRGSFRSGAVEVLVAPDPDRLALGMSFDRRSNLLYVASGFNGVAYVYDGSTGSEVATIPLTTPGAGFINDAAVARDAVYFTDSFQAVIYKVPLGPAGRLSTPAQVEEIPLSGDFELVPQPPPPDFIVNANGIVVTPNNRWLIIVNTALGTLYRVDPSTGYADLIDLGGADVATGDGLVLRGHTLYVVQNFMNQIGVIRLKGKFTRGVYVKALTNDAFRIPTTAAYFRKALYAVNARFDEIDPFNVPPDAEFEIVRTRITK
jgi:hypothetical protein